MQPLRSALSLVSATIRAAGSAALAHLAVAYLLHHSRQQAEELSWLIAKHPAPVAPACPVSTEVH